MRQNRIMYEIDVRVIQIYLNTMSESRNSQRSPTYLGHDAKAKSAQYFTDRGNRSNCSLLIGWVFT